jgi:hypothetical protein
VTSSDTPLSSQDLDPRPVPAGRGEAPVEGQQAGAQDLGQGQVHGVVGGDVPAGCPHSRQQAVVRAAGDVEVGQIGESLAGPVTAECAREMIPAESLGDLDVEQVRRVKRLFRSRDARPHR